ncbi:alkaline phosphatase D family protein [Gordonia sp. PKS22-38]|uniref:Alkaline phosphatase D family protein n=1 Tax=Gordonia prachuapensis TaxID=3115651 RepID=A0ABU7MR86_9ACTN|nr:alkaline phosphatase D family protein [Gordonia sp. PKS22-38]
MPSSSPDIVVTPDRGIRVGITRRRFLSWTGAAAALAFTPGLLADTTASSGAMRPGGDLFGLGVASGDPLPDGVILWTRLAPNPLARGSGMGPDIIDVDWEVADDESMRRIVRKGRTRATPAAGHSVHVDVRGLAPAREYFYRFTAGGARSSIGRTVTAPVGTASSMTFAHASCQSWADGFYVAYADMAAHAPDVVFHLGDYIYEKPIHRGGGARETAEMPESAARECLDLDDYRDRYALYKLDPHLQDIHRTSPFVCAFDDHEVDNNWAATIPEDGMPVPDFLVRRAHALRAWWENTPVRLTPRAPGADIRAYRRFRYGTLAEFNVLDTRSHRTDQPNGDGDTAQNTATADRRHTILGSTQERWLLDGFGRSPARWNVLAHQTTIADLARDDDGVRAVSMDGWSGYEASRKRVLEGARDRGVSNLVSVVGDIHRNVVADLRTTYRYESPTLGVEVAATSIASGGDGEDSDRSDRALKAASPHVRFGNAQRGYVLNRVRPDRWEAEFRVADSIRSPDESLHTRAVVTIAHDQPDVDVV